MFTSEWFDKMSQTMTDALPSSVKAAHHDLQQQFRTILQSGLQQLQLITREEFDAQTKVLARTRAKVEALERQVAELEALVKQEQSKK